MTAPCLLRRALVAAALLALCPAAGAQGLPEGVTPAVASLVQLAYGERLGPRELADLGRATEAEWIQRPDSRDDLAALVESARRLAESGLAGSEEARAAVRRALEVSGDRDRGPLGAWLRGFRASLVPLDVAGAESVTGRQVLDLLWAAVRLRAAGFGVPVALNEPVSPERLAATAGRVLGMPDGARLLARSADLAATVDGQFGGPDGPASAEWAHLARRAAGLPDLALPGGLRPGDASPSVPRAPWRPARVPGMPVSFWAPADWVADPAQPAGYLTLRGPGGAEAGDPLSNAIRVFVGAGSERALSGREGLEAEVRGRLTESGAEVGFAVSGPFASALGAGWADDDLLLYALRAHEGTVVAVRGVWPAARFRPEECVALFHRVWTSQRAEGWTPRAVGLDEALRALDALPAIEDRSLLDTAADGLDWRAVGATR